MYGLKILKSTFLEFLKINSTNLLFTFLKQLTSKFQNMHLSIIQTNRKKQNYEKQIVESRKNKNLDLSYCVYYLI